MRKAMPTIAESSPAGRPRCSTPKSTSPDRMNAEYMDECCQSLMWSTTNFPFVSYRFLRGRGEEGGGG